MKQTKKPAIDAVPLVQAVEERAERIRAKGKPMRPLPAAADMPPVEVIKLDGTREQGDRMLQDTMMQAGRARAWFPVIVALDALLHDPYVLTNPATVEWVRVLQAQLPVALLADNATEALAALDEVLPMGKMGARHSEAQALRRRDKPAVSGDYDPTRNNRIRKRHAQLLADNNHNATALVAAEFDLSPRQISRILRT